MRILTKTIGVAGGAYITWKLISPLPVSAYPCGDNTACTGPSVPVAAAEVLRPDLRIALYDPATGPPRQYENEAPHATWISSADSASVGEMPRPGAAVPRQTASVTVTGLGQPGARGFCLVMDGGKRRCVAFTTSPVE